MVYNSYVQQNMAILFFRYVLMVYVCQDGSPSRFGQDGGSSLFCAKKVVLLVSFVPDAGLYM
jgi:hypothetical protein